MAQEADQGGLILWEICGRQGAVSPAKIDAVALAFSPDGKLVTCEARENSVCLLDAETGRSAMF